MLFFDSYAIFEIFDKNPSYAKYADEEIVTSVLNVAEVHYGCLKQKQPEKSMLLLPRLIEFDVKLVKKAMEFRFHHKNKKMSMVDCIGYMIANDAGIPFLTGDKEFKDLPNVEFVK